MTYIETERLILRDWCDSDQRPFIQLNQDARVMEYFPTTLSKQEVKAMLNRIKSHFTKWEYGLFAAELKADRSFIGFIGLSHPRFELEFTPCVEIGWRLAWSSWGKGLATEGAKAVINYGFDNLKLAEIYSFTSLNNQRSENVMKKIGMKKIGSFFHPNLPANSPLSEHCLYKISNQRIRAT